MQYQRTDAAQKRYCAWEVWISKSITSLLEFQPGPTRAALMKATEPETNLSVDWILDIKIYCITKLRTYRL